MPDITFSTGVIEMSVNGKRTIRFNPADVGFIETLYTLMAKVEAIEKEGQTRRSKQNDPAKDFDSFRRDDIKMKEAVDAVFGEGFCDDVFDGVRLVALSDGLTVLEQFVFAVLDHVDASVRDNIEKRNAKIEQYTAKYKSRVK